VGVEAFFYGYDETWFKSHIRAYIPADLRTRSDELFNLLFWDVDIAYGDRSKTVLQPTYHCDTDCWLYSAATVSYIVNNIIDLEYLHPYFDKAIAHWSPEEREKLSLRNLDDFDTFLWWVNAWSAIFTTGAALGQVNPWALTIYLS
jgi:hypothetical protein